MSRNMIESNKKIFLRLIECAQKSLRVIEHLDKARWIQTSNEEKAWLQDMELGDVRTISPRVKTARFSYVGRNFFVTVGFTEPTEPAAVFEPFDLNAGVFAALIAELDVPVREGVDPLAVVNE